MNYYDELVRSMTWFGENTDSVVVGQGVKAGGHGMSNHFKNFPTERLVEFPVAEEFQMGWSLGYALRGKTVISVYPRFNFLLLALNQLTNHLDKWPLITENKSHPKVIVKVGVGSTSPLHPGHQHIGNFAKQFSELCPNMDVWTLDKSEDIFDTYQTVHNTPKSAIVIEFMEKYSS